MRIKVALSRVIDEMEGRVRTLFGGGFVKRKSVRTPYVSRPALILTGFTKEFPRDRIQVLGLTEREYLLHVKSSGGEGGVYRSLKLLFERRPPAVILARYGRKTPRYLLRVMENLSREFKIPVLATDMETAPFISTLSDRLQYLLAQRTYVHGVMVEIHGVGVLITGKAGAGKSESALELIRRGHRLIADDIVLVKRYPPTSLYAEPPPGREDLMFFMFIRGIGTVYVPHYFGVGAVRRGYELNVIVHLSDEEGDEFSGPQEVEILGIRVPKYTVRLHPLKATATVVEGMALHFKAHTLKGIIRLPDMKEILFSRLQGGRADSKT